MREFLIYFFNLKKSAAKVHKLLVEAYGDALSERSCREWFQKFKNDEFDVEDQERKVESVRRRGIGSIIGDSCQTQKELALTLGVTQQFHIV